MSTLKNHQKAFYMLNTEYMINLTAWVGHGTFTITKTTTDQN